jgi:hypothetical protein
MQVACLFGRGWRRSLLASVSIIALSLLATSCSGSGGASGQTTSTSTSSTITTASTSPATTPTTASAVATPTVWLCRPGAVKDPCAYTRSVTTVQSNGSRSTGAFPSPPPSSSASNFDCFYVYPTVSTEKERNTGLNVTSAEIGAAVEEASPFSNVCSVWAPMYRSATTSSIQGGLAGDQQLLQSTFTVAYNSLLSAWNDFIAHDDDGRPIILIGHSQGSAILIHLIATQLDNEPSLLNRLVVAIIAGGNLQVPIGKTVGATLTHVPLCTSSTQTGCAIAYSSFPSEPPQDTLFGRPGQGVSLQSDQTAKSGEQVACVNPAALSGGSALLSPFFLSVTQTLSPAPTSHWVSYPNMYSASCEASDGASWLQVTHIAGAGDTRPLVGEPLGPTWGYHDDDLNLAAGNLVQDVATEEQSWSSSHG